MQVDYSSQLQEIARALNRPSTPTWLIAMLSALLGFLTAVLSQIFQHWHGEWRAPSKMRMIIYSEIGSMYSLLVLVEDQKHANSEWRRKVFERFLKFEGEKYIEDNKAVFIELKERSPISEIYRAVRDVFEPEEQGLGVFLNCGLAIEVIEDYVRMRDLPYKYVRRYMNNSDAAAIDKANKRRLGASSS